MSDIQHITAEPREKAGKGSARAARRSGKVPAVIYGDKKEVVMINIARNELVSVINRGHFLTSQFEIKLDGKTERVLPRDIQVHPVTDDPLHVDFLRLGKGAKIVLDIPVNFVDEEKSEGLERGGVLNIVRHEIELSVPGDAIPDQIDVSLAGLDINDAVKFSSIDLPKGCEPVITDRDFTIATISAPSGMNIEEEDAAAMEGTEEEMEEPELVGRGKEEGEEGEEAEAEGEDEAEAKE